MIKKIHFTLILLFVFSAVFSQKNSNIATQLSEITIDSLMFDQADKMGEALKKEDFETFASYTFPEIIEKMGGLDSFLLVMKLSFGDLEAQGVTINSIAYGKRSDFVKTKTNLQCILPQEMTIKVKGGTLNTLTYLIAISPDEGKKWYFVDTSGQKIGQMRDNMPSISSELILPEAVPPVFVQD